MAAISTYVKNNTMGSITLKDSTGTPVTLALAYDKGDLAISGLGPKLNEVTHVQRRGKHVCSVLGNRRYPQATISVFVPNMVGSSSSAPGSPAEFISLLGAYSGNTNVQGTGRPAAINVVYTIEGTNFGDTADETITMNSATVMSFDFAEAVDGNTMTINLEIAGSVVVVNNTNTVTFDQLS